MPAEKKLIEQLTSPDQHRRVNFYQNPDGTYTYDQETFADAPEEQVWIPVASQTTKLYDSLQTARREAAANLDWLRDDSKRHITDFVRDTDLKQLMQRFISGEDRSLNNAHAIEGKLIQNYSDTPLFEKLTIPLASYSPGQHQESGLYTEEALAAELRYVLEHEQDF